MIELLAVVAFLLCEVFRGDTLRGGVGFVSVSYSGSLSVIVVRLVRFGGDAVLCLFGDLVLDLLLTVAAAAVHVGADSRNGMILLARAIGYEEAMIS